MSRILPLALFPVLLVGASALCAEEPVKPAKVEEAKPAEGGESATCSHHCGHGFPWHRSKGADSKDEYFGATVQVNAPLRDLKTQLDGRVGYGLGLQWIHDHNEGHASRTRMEYNVFAEGPAVGPSGVKTYAKNYVLGWDHLFKLNTGATHLYLVAGVGGIRWVQDRSDASGSTSFQTTKLEVTGGLGLRIANNVNVETRYVFSGIQKTFDSNMVQASLGWRF